VLFVGGVGYVLFAQCINPCTAPRDRPDQPTRHWRIITCEEASAVRCGRDLAEQPSAGFFLSGSVGRNTAVLRSLKFESNEANMKHTFYTLAVCLLLTTAAQADESAIPSNKAETAANEDCSKQVWPHFSAACLRNNDRAIRVRLVTANRRDAER